MFNDRITTTLTKMKNQPSSQYWLLAVITIFAAALRFYKLGEWSFWIDEIFTVNRVLIHYSDLLVVLQNLPSRLWLPISFILTKVSLDMFGVTEYTARLVSALIGVITIPVLFFSSRKYFGIGTALILALLLAVSPWHVYWSQNARFYTSLLLLYTLAAFVFYNALEQDRPWSFVLFYGLLYLAMSERLQSAFLLPVAFAYMGSLWIFRFEIPPGLRRRNLIIFTAPFLLMLLFELTRYLLLGSSTTMHFVEDFSGIQIGDPFRLSLAIIFNIGFPVFTIGMFSGIYLIIKKNRAGLFLLISAVLPVLLLVIFNPILFTKDRYVFMTLPFWLLLTAITLKELYIHTGGIRKILALGVLFVFLAQAGSSLLLYYNVNHGHRLEWRTAFNIVQEKSQPEDEVVAFWPEFGPYYLDREITPWEDVQVDTIEVSAKSYWFVLDSETIWINLLTKTWLEEQAELIEVLYLRQPEGDFNIRIYKYDPDK